jgi:hypothetical protein
VVHQDVANNSGGNAEEVSPVPPGCAGLIDEAQIGFVYESRALQSVAGVLLPQEPLRDQMQLSVDERDQAVDSLAVAAFPFGQQLCYVTQDAIPSTFPPKN